MWTTPPNDAAAEDVAADWLINITCGAPDAAAQQQQQQLRRWLTEVLQPAE